MNPAPDPAAISNSKGPIQIQNPNLNQNYSPRTEEEPTSSQTGIPGTVQNHSSVTAPSKHSVLSPGEDQTNSVMNSVNISVLNPGSEVANPPRDPDPDLNQNQTEDHSPNRVIDSTQSHGLGSNEVLYPVQIKNLDQNQTIVLTKPSGPEKSPAQSIVVRVPALALLKALVKNTGQTHVRIPLQTQGPGSVLVPSTTPSNIHLTASVQSLMQHPGLVQNRVQSPGIILSPVRNLGPVPSPGQNPSNLLSPVPNSLQSPGLAQTPTTISFPAPAPDQTKTLVPNPVWTPGINPIQSKSSAPNSVHIRSSVTTQAWASQKDNPAESSSDPGPDLVRVPLPPETVRALSPPSMTTPLKPSVPPLGFRLNGKLIPLLPGAEVVEMSFRSHPSGSKSSLTSLHLTKTPAPAVFPDPPRPARPSIRLPRPISTGLPLPSVRAFGESTPKPLKKTPAPLPVKTQKNHMTPKPKPRPHVTLPRPQRPIAAIAATLLRKGEVIRRPPPDCTVCKSSFKPMPELRGFACMCSSDVSSALQILKLRRKDERVKSRLKRKLNLLNQQQRVSKPRSFHTYATSKSSSSLQKPLRMSEHFLAKPHPSVSPGVSWLRPSVSPGASRPRPSPSPGVLRPRPSASPSAPVPSEVSSPCSGTEVTVGGAVGRLVIHLEDFYYGSAEGEPIEQLRLVTTYRCMHCAQELPNNISMMQHTRAHIVEYFRGSCSHCFSQFFSSRRLQRHLEVVHGPNSCSSRVVCRICEIEFENEVTLLLHMKDMHKPGEMPYACGLCGFRSSFFAQTWKHFEEVHADTRHFLCPLCLRAFKTDRTFQQHVAGHLRKQVYSCDRCRLHFHVAKDRQDHQEQHHGTHIRPAQLIGLRPGTMVSVRTFQVAPPESPGQTKPSAAFSNIVPNAKAMQQRACKRKAVESLGQLLAQLHSSECGRCVECLSRFKDFQSHFPTRVTCSLCHFQTCCSCAYANHMIDNHSGNRKRPLYPHVFTSCPRSDSGLECLTCGFSCQTGDVMAQHLSKNTKHTCLLTEAAEEELSDHADEQSSVRSRGRFISIKSLSSTHLSVTTLDRPAHLSSPAAMTITVRGPAQPLSKLAAPLAVSRLWALLHSLLHGTVSASKRYGVSQTLIYRWAREQRKSLTNRRWRWDTSGGARWVITEREQNHIVTQDAILDLSLRTLGTKTPLQARLNWAVDFLLRHDLGLETRSKELRDIGYSVVTRTWDKVTSFLLPPPRFCCMDEFPVFMDPVALSTLAPDALRVWGHREELPLVEVLLCGTSEGSLLPPMLFYNKDLPPLPHGFPTNVILQAREGGYSPGERTQLWADKVWLPHLVDSAPSLLLLDEHSGHMTLDFQEPLRHCCTELVYIPQGCGFLVQPLDQCVAPVVREFLKVRWSQLVSQSPEFSESDLVLTLACWFSEVCHILNRNKDFIHRSFLCVGTRYKTAEVTHHTLQQSLRQALIKIAPPVSTTSQSVEAEECEEEGLKADGQSEDDRTETPRPTGDEDLWMDNQPNLQLQITELMEVDQSEAQEQTEGQSEAQEETERQSEAQEETEGQSEAQEQTEGQSEAQE